MKAATGELNLTVITVIAIAAVMGFFSLLMWPKIQTTIKSQWDKTSNTNISDDTNYITDNTGTTSGDGD